MFRLPENSHGLKSTMNTYIPLVENNAASLTGVVEIGGKKVVHYLNKSGDKDNEWFTSGL
jgi:hypothetical protein